jgi:hypothetical protein
MFRTKGGNHVQATMSFRMTALATAALIALPTAGRAQDQTVRLEGASVAIFNLAGRISVSPGSGSDVAVTIRRQGSDGDRLEVQTGPVDVRRSHWGKTPSLRILYPSDRIHYEEFQGNTELRVRDDGTFWGGNGWRDGDRVKIGNRVDGLDAHADLDIAVPEGKRVYVALAAGTIEARNVNGDLFLDTGSGSISTAGTHGELNLDTGSGDVTVDGADGEVYIDTGSGDVIARNVRGPDLSIDTGSGNVRVEGAESPEISLDTGSGDVTLLGARTGEVSVDTGSGDVEIETVAGSASISVDTGSGGVRVAVPGDYRGDVRLETSSGELHTDMPITLVRRSEDEIEGRIGEGGSARITIETGSGDIEIRRS